MLRYLIYAILAYDYTVFTLLFLLGPSDYGLRLLSDQNFHAAFYLIRSLTVHRTAYHGRTLIRSNFSQLPFQACRLKDRTNPHSDQRSQHLATTSGTGTSGELVSSSKSTLSHGLMPPPTSRERREIPHQSPWRPARESHHCQVFAPCVWKAGIADMRSKATIYCI